jgi:ubiquinone/menaquinone biosynthesis C-methylase UbiE
MATTSNTRREALAYGAGQTARIGWYLGHYIATRRWFARIEPQHAPSTLRGRLADLRIQAALVREGLALLKRDFDNVQAGIYPMPKSLIPNPAAALAGAVRYWRDLPEVTLRRRRGEAQEPFEGTAREENQGKYPRYYLQNFHFQSGGWLTEQSAALYDTQVEILFGGVADAMRRQGLVPISSWLAENGAAENGAGVTLLDLGCGTGNMLRAVREAFPGMTLSGLDLSEAYLARAAKQLKDPSISWHAAPAETIPLADGSVDLVSAVYLFHELPRKVRCQVLSEVARVLNPGGRFVLVDALQLGNLRALDPVIAAFPKQFHEPYFQDWIESDLRPMFEDAGLRMVTQSPAYLSKVFVGARG